MKYFQIHLISSQTACQGTRGLFLLSTLCSDILNTDITMQCGSSIIENEPPSENVRIHHLRAQSWKQASASSQPSSKGQLVSEDHQRVSQDVRDSCVNAVHPKRREMSREEDSRSVANALWLVGSWPGLQGVLTDDKWDCILPGYSLCLHMHAEFQSKGAEVTVWWAFLSLTSVQPTGSSPSAHLPDAEVDTWLALANEMGAEVMYLPSVWKHLISGTGRPRFSCALLYCVL